LSVASPRTQSNPTGTLESARRLHAHLARHHVHGDRLEGPDQGVRWNIRVWRFAKSYLPVFPRERFFFLQGQGYWSLASWTLFDLTADPAYRDHARRACRAILESQREDGSWAYPLRERRHLVATVEGDFGAVALIEAHRRGLGEPYLAGARKWHGYVEREIGYQAHPSGGLAVNYFQQPRGMVPNNTAEWIWTLGRLARATAESRFLDRVPALLTFLEAVMLPSGELPYELASSHPRSVAESRTRIHYLCFQYNAFQCMKLAWYALEHRDPRARALAVRLASFLATGVTHSGAVRASCGSVEPEVIYYGDAVGYALHLVTRAGWADHAAAAERAFAFVRSRQRPDGGFRYFSRGDYHVLSDRNEYPRYLASTLFHLAERERADAAVSAEPQP
jgi:hypothetical protein